jgi:hypothetical protein
VNEVDNNTMEGTWSGLRNFPSPFRRVVSKYYPGQYVAVFQWAVNCPTICSAFIQALMCTNFAL